MQVKKCLITVLFSLSLMPLDSNAGWYDQWLAVWNFFGSTRKPSLQVPQWFKNVKKSPLKVGLVSVGALAIVGGGYYWYKKRKNRVSQNLNTKQKIEIQEDGKQKQELEDFYVKKRNDLFGRIVTLLQTSSAYKEAYIGQPGVVKQVWIVRLNTEQVGTALTVKILNPHPNEQAWIYLSMTTDKVQIGQVNAKETQEIDILDKMQHASQGNDQLKNEVLDGLTQSIGFYDQIPKSDEADRKDFKEYVLNYLVKRFDKIVEPFSNASKEIDPFIEKIKALN